MKKATEAQKLEDDILSLKEQLKRALADYDNLQKRTHSEKEALIFNAHNRLLVECLPIIELLKKAQENLNDRGLEIVKKEFEALLKRYGVSEIGQVDEEFDPNLHEAVTTEKGGQNNQIAEVIQTGYKINGVVVKPAIVKVFSNND